jgi:hypothetical protein
MYNYCAILFNKNKHQNATQIHIEVERNRDIRTPLNMSLRF